MKKSELKKLDLVLMYLYNNCEKASDEYRQLRNNVWFRDPDELDLLEQLSAKIKMDVYNKSLMDVCRLLGSASYLKE